jgi:hypothetical protein
MTAFDPNELLSKIVSQLLNIKIIESVTIEKDDPTQYRIIVRYYNFKKYVSLIIPLIEIETANFDVVEYTVQQIQHYIDEESKKKR